MARNRKRNVRNNITDTIEAEWGCLQSYSKGKLLLSDHLSLIVFLSKYPCYMKGTDQRRYNRGMQIQYISRHFLINHRHASCLTSNARFVLLS